MKLAVVIVITLLCAVAFAQTGTEPPPRAPLPPAPASVNLNDSDNARKARTVLDQTIQSLGGQPYLTYENREETGRYYPLYHGHTNSTGIYYNYYIEYPDKDRFEVIHTKDIFLIEGQVGNVKVKNKFDIVQISQRRQGIRDNLQGNVSAGEARSAELSPPPPAFARMGLPQVDRDPSVALFYDGQAVVDGKETEGVTLLNSQNDSVSVYLDLNSHYPVKISYSWRDPKDKQKNTEDEIYDNYKLVQGIWTPHSITRYYNGESSQQRFITTASYNLKLPDSMFEAEVTYDPKLPLKKR
jgi:hypothetical protein